LIALDANILVYAHREESPHHAQALRLMRQLSEGSEPWAVPWQCVSEFLRVVTHPKIFRPPTSLADALETVDDLLSSPSVRLLGPSDRHWLVFRETLRDGQAEGNLVYDAHIAATLREHGVAEILTADRDFRRFRGIRMRDPFTA